MHIRFFNPEHNEYHHELAQLRDWYHGWYGITMDGYPSQLVHATSTQSQDKPLGYCGTTFANPDRLLTTEWYVDSVHLARALNGKNELDRSLLCELGSLVTEPGAHAQKRERQKIVCLLTAANLLAAHEAGKQYVILTGAPFMKLHARLLGVTLKDFGTPDLSRRSAKYRATWQPYFERVERRCYGFRLEEAVEGCQKLIDTLMERRKPPKNFSLWTPETLTPKPPVWASILLESK